MVLIKTVKLIPKIMATKTAKTGTENGGQTKVELNKMKLADLIKVAEGLGFSYNFEKKPVIVDYILANQGAAPAALAKEEKTSAPKEAAAKKEDAVEIPEPEAEADATPAEEKAAPAKGKKVAAPAKGKKPAAKKADKKESAPKASKSKATSDEDLEKLKAKPEIQEILNLKDKDGNDHTKSEKVRRLYFRQNVTIGQAAKLMGIHYSFAFCVIDAFRKQHSDKK